MTDAPILQATVENFLRTKRYIDAQAILLEALLINGPIDAQEVLSAALANVIGGRER